MADKAHFVEYLKAMQNEDGQIRNQAEAFLKDIAAKNTDGLVDVGLQVIADQTLEPAVRTTCCVLLKKLLTVFEGDQVKGYKLLSAEGKLNFQRNVLILLASTTQVLVKDQICDLISDVASSVLVDDTLPQADKWNSLAQHLFELMSTQQNSNTLSVFRIFEGLFANAATHFLGMSDSIIKMIAFGLQHEALDINLASLDCLASLVQTLSAKQLRPFKSLAPYVIALIRKSLETKEEDRIQDCIGSVYDMCEAEPAFFKSHFAELLSVMSVVRSASSDPDSALKTESVECLVFLVERFPKLITADQQLLLGLLDLIFKNMMEIDSEVPAEWCSPPDGFNDDFEEDDDQKNIKIGMDHIDRLMCAVENSVVLAGMNTAVSHLLSSSEWKMHHAAIMAMSQLGEYMSEKLTTDISTILTQVLHFSKNPNPRIRYACCHLLGQYADDLNPDFQNAHHNIYFTTVLPLLDDPIPRVVAHALASLTNFLENSNSAQVAPFFDHLYAKIMHWLANGIGYVKEASLSTLSALCEGSGDLFFAKYDETMMALFAVFEQAKSPQHKQLRGNAIECATIIGKICGIERFTNYYPKLIDYMISIQDLDIDANGFDAQRTYIMSGWQRVVIAIEDRFKPFIPRVIPRLLQIAHTAQANTSQGTRTSDAEEAEVAVQTLAVFLDNLGVDLVPYLQDIFKVLSIIIEQTPNDETRIEAVKTMPSLIKLYAKAGQDVATFGRHVNQMLWNFMEREEDASLLSEFAFTVQKTLKNMGPVLTDEEMNAIGKKCFEHLQRSQKRKNEMHEHFDREEDNQVDIDNIIENDNQMEDEFGLEIANVLGVIFRVYGQRALPLFNEVNQNLIVPALASANNKARHFALFLIDDSVEHIGNLIPKELLKKFLEELSRHALDPNLELRQAALFGIGITAIALGDDFKPVLSKVVEVLVQAIELPKPEDEYLKFFLTVRENGVASLGKILNVFGQSFAQTDLANLLSFWLKQLPIVHDHKEAGNQHKFLIRLVQANLINMSDPAVLKTVIGVFSRIYQRKKLSDEETNLAIAHVMTTLVSSPQHVAVLEAAGLEESQKEFILKFKA